MWVGTLLLHTAQAFLVHTHTHLASGVMCPPAPCRLPPSPPPCRVVVKGVPCAIAAMRRDGDGVNLRLYGERITYRRNRRRLIEVGYRVVVTQLSSDEAPSWREACTREQWIIVNTGDHLRAFTHLPGVCHVQVVLSHDSPLIGRKLTDPLFKAIYGATPVGVRTMASAHIRASSSRSSSSVSTESTYQHRPSQWQPH
jgi:hypothetical protein